MSSSHYQPDKSKIDTWIKAEGNKVTIQPQALSITWGGDQRYWRINAGSGTAELVQVSWLQVEGQIPESKLEKDSEYSVTFNLELKADAFGWSDSPVYFSVRSGSSSPVWRSVDLSKSGKKPSVPAQSSLKTKYSGGPLKIGMYEIWKGRWKGGLIIHGVTIEKVGQ